MADYSLEDKTLWLFDVDNTLILDVDHPTVFSDALNLWNRLLELEKTNAILTNVGRLSSRQIYNAVSGAGYSVDLDKTFSAGAAAAAYIANQQTGARCFVIGEGGAQEDFIVKGLDVTNNPPVDFVAIGADRGMTFAELNFATKMVKDGAGLICISGSRDYPGIYLGSEDVYIGERSIVAAIEDATGVEAVIVGKPLPEIFHATVELLGFSITDSVMVGDNPQSDIAGGRAAGMMTILVDRGKENIVPFDSGDLDKTPHMHVKSLDEIVKLF
ncbi:MAG: HAD hydrolase-like protein [Candidatus Lokiarchaeota archaeon]|nr:HAD hydrolase-like protein [Candidatus Lokiarchaeota archaeon]